MTKVKQPTWYERIRDAMVLLLLGAVVTGIFTQGRELATEQAKNKEQDRQLIELTNQIQQLTRILLDDKQAQPPEKDRSIFARRRPKKLSMASPENLGTSPAHRYDDPKKLNKGKS